jgi:hypothetical protein
MGDFGKDITSVAFMLGGIALVALLVSQSSGFATDVKAVTSGYGSLLGIVTLQNNYGNTFSS